MKRKIKSAYMLNDTPLTICDAGAAYYGGSQHWFPNEAHRRSGCGPVAAANITAYLSQTWPDKFHPLYPYKADNGLLAKENFVEHMIEIRKHVIPGVRGLTSVRQFAEQVMEFARQRDISLTPHILNGEKTGLEQAVAFISQALAQNLPVAVLVLTHPIEELSEYTWHWMTITGLKPDSQSGFCSITVSSYGERREINLNLLWNHRTEEDIIDLAYFTQSNK